MHSIFCEGVWYDPDGTDSPLFFPLRGPTDEEVQQVVLDARRRTLRWLLRNGVVHPDEELDGQEDLLAESDPVRAWCTKAAVMDRIAIGNNAGQLVARLRNEVVQAKKKGRRCAHADGFDVHANVRIGQMARDHLERLVRYILRPALCAARLERLSDGRILAQLKRTWSDGMSHVKHRYIRKMDWGFRQTHSGSRSTSRTCGVAGGPPWRPGPTCRPCGTNSARMHGPGCSGR